MFEKLQKFHAQDRIPFPYEPQFKMVRDLLADATAAADKADMEGGDGDGGDGKCGDLLCNGTFESPLSTLSWRRLSLRLLRLTAARRCASPAPTRT